MQRGRGSLLADSYFLDGHSDVGVENLKEKILQCHFYLYLYKIILSLIFMPSFYFKEHSAFRDGVGCGLGKMTISFLLLTRLNL